MYRGLFPELGDLNTIFGATCVPAPTFGVAVIIVIKILERLEKIGTKIYVPRTL